MSFQKSEVQATNGVNALLVNLLPGATKININRLNNKKNSNKGSKARLIDHNLKKNIEIKERDTYKIKKKSKLLKKKILRSSKVEQESLEQTAKLNILKKHRVDGTLTKKEKKYLKVLSNRNINKAKSWDLDEDDKDDFESIQNHILDYISGDKNHDRHKRRRSKKKEFKEEFSSTRLNKIDNRYPGLTPGLAPVGLSDEEESSEEEGF